MLGPFVRVGRVGRVAVAALVVAACVASAPRVARAQSEETRDEAKRLFSVGSSEYLARRYADALDHLRASYKLVPSPNSGLLIARCLRELGRPVEAVEEYTAVSAEARRDAKYEKTAEAAQSEGAALRATLGTIHVRVARPPPGSRIEIDGNATPATDAELVVLHAAGEVTVRFKPATGAEQSQRATLPAGGDLRMEFTATAASPAAGPLAVAPPPHGDDRAPPEPATAGEPPAWTLPAAIAAGGVALVGGAVFIGFKLESDSIYDKLRARCGPSSCGPGDVSDADAGRRDQTIAYVGLAVGAVGAASAIAFLLVRAYGPRRDARSVRSVEVGIGSVRARF